MCVSSARSILPFSSLSYSFKHSLKSSKHPWSLSFLHWEKMGRNSSNLIFFSPESKHPWRLGSEKLRRPSSKLTLLLGASKLLNGGVGGVQVEGAQKVAKVHAVNAIAFIVEDGECELSACKIDTQKERQSGRNTLLRSAPPNLAARQASSQPAARVGLNLA